MSKAMIEGWPQLDEWFSKGGDLGMRDQLGIDVLPSWDNVYRAFELTPLNKVRVVIVGQDPYPAKGVADGLAFSTAGEFIPASLRNIFQELPEGTPKPLHGSLAHWAEQGVLLLNAVLTTSPGHPGAHRGLGWERLTTQAIRAVASTQNHVVFVLWGYMSWEAFQNAVSDEFGAWKRERGHRLIRTVHPSPKSAHKGFFGSRPFDQINNFLSSPIDWSVI